MRGVVVLLTGCLAMAAPFFAGPLTFFLGGLLLITCGVLEMLETYATPDASGAMLTSAASWRSCPVSWF